MTLTKQKDTVAILIIFYEPLVGAQDIGLKVPSSGKNKGQCEAIQRRIDSITGQANELLSEIYNDTSSPGDKVRITKSDLRGICSLLQDILAKTCHMADCSGHPSKELTYQINRLKRRQPRQMYQTLICQHSTTTQVYAPQIREALYTDQTMSFQPVTNKFLTG